MGTAPVSTAGAAGLGCGCGWNPLESPHTTVPGFPESGWGAQGSGFPPRACASSERLPAASLRGINIYGRLKIAVALCFPLTCGVSGVRGSC